MTSVYGVYEYHENDKDSLKTIVPGDVESIQWLIEWCEENAPHEFSAAYSSPEYMDEGEWYLAKEHGVTFHD